MNWWRAHHGISTDPKYAVVLRHIASRCVTEGHATSRAEIVAVWVWVLDYSSQNYPRGSLNGIDPAQIGVTLDIPDETVISILSGLDKTGMVSGNYLKAWDKRQPKKEDQHADRQREYRDRKRTKEENVTPRDAVVTPRDDVTPSRVYPRDLLSSSLTNTSVIGNTTGIEVSVKEISKSENRNGAAANGRSPNVNGKPNGIHTESRFGYLADDSFNQFVVVACELWPDLIPEDLQASWQFTWKKWNFEQKALCVKNTRAQIESGADSRFVTRPPRYLESGDWKRPPRKTSSPKETREERISRELLED